MSGVELSTTLKPLVLLASPAAKRWFSHTESTSGVLGAALILPADAHGYLLATARHVADGEGWRTHTGTQKVMVSEQELVMVPEQERVPEQARAPRVAPRVMGRTAPSATTCHPRFRPVARTPAKTAAKRTRALVTERVHAPTSPRAGKSCAAWPKP